MSTHFRSSRLVRRMLALPVVLCASVAVLNAQTGNAVPAPQNSGSSFNLQMPAHLEMPAFSSSSSSSSSMDGSTSAAPDELLAANSSDHFNFLNAQYGRSRYGHPRYRGGNTNADGSEKYTFFAGVGLSAPTRDGNSDYLIEGYGFQVGAGRNFSKKVGMNLQFDYNHFGFTGSTIAGQSYLYFADLSNSNGLDGNSHIWSLTLNPTYTFYSSEGLGAYVVIGGGFYHKTANFFVPEVVTGFDPYSGFEYQYVANQTIDDYSSNSPGGNAGIGLTYKFSRFANERFYAEARVVHTFNSFRPGVTPSSSIAAINAEYNSRFNFFPQNSQSTTYVPINVGIRF